MDGSHVFKLSADHVALNFVNTLDDRFVPHAQVEKLLSYADVLRFAGQTKLLTAAQISGLSRASKQGNAAHVWQATLEMREVLARIFYSVVNGQRVDGRELERLNESLGQSSRHRHLSQESGGFVWRWDGLEKSLEAPLWLLAQEAANLLTSPSASYIRACQRESCRWLFLDVSKNHSRRWCDMKVCGNRVKASRYYALHGHE